MREDGGTRSAPGCGDCVTACLAAGPGPHPVGTCGEGKIPCADDGVCGFGLTWPGTRRDAWEGRWGHMCQSFRDLKLETGGGVPDDSPNYHAGLLT